MGGFGENELVQMFNDFQGQKKYDKALDAITQLLSNYLSDILLDLKPDNDAYLKQKLNTYKK